MSFKAGTLLQNGRYVIDVPLGQGYFGSTYRAMHANLVQPVVIKTLHDSLREHQNYEDFKRQFIEQARCLAKCLHPHLPRLLDLFEEEGQPFVVMDYVPGSTLAQLVDPEHLMPVDRALNYVQQLGSALTAIHAEGLLHRDIQPQNAIRQSGTDRIILIDVGFTRDFTPGVSQTHTSLLATGYAAPEQYDPQQPRTPATDVYSLAALLYYLLTATTPIVAPLRDRIPLPSPRQLNSAISRELDAVILNGLAVNPAQRPTSIDIFLAYLSESVSSQPSSRPSRRANQSPASSESLPPLARPWVPTLFAVTSIVAAIGGASSVTLLRASSFEPEANPYQSLRSDPTLTKFRSSGDTAMFENRTMPDTWTNRDDRSPTDPNQAAPNNEASSQRRLEVRPGYNLDPDNPYVLPGTPTSETAETLDPASFDAPVRPAYTQDYPSDLESAPVEALPTETMEQPSPNTAPTWSNPAPEAIDTNPVVPVLEKPAAETQPAPALEEKGLGDANRRSIPVTHPNI